MQFSASVNKCDTTVKSTPREANTSTKYYVKIYFYTFHILWPKVTSATGSEIWRILRFYTMVILTPPKLLFIHHFNTFLGNPSKVYWSSLKLKWSELKNIDSSIFYHIYMQIQTISGPISWKKSGFGQKSGENRPNWSTDDEIGFLAICVFYNFPKEVAKIFFLLEIAFSVTKIH